MGLYLNSDSILKKYTRLYKNEYFVDKSLIINQINKLIGSFDVYLCVTRPRRFGKTSLINMLGAYYSKAADSSQIFDNLKISQANGYREHLNKYNVISISFNEFFKKEKYKLKLYIICFILSSIYSYIFYCMIKENFRNTV